MTEGIQSYGTYGAKTVTEKTGSGSNHLTMNDFLSLMVAQLSNQDMFNTVDDAQFLTQMAQFSMTQALTELSKITSAAYQVSSAVYSVSLIGKEATISQTNTDGTPLLRKGIVEGVNLLNENAEVIIDGAAYPVTSIAAVREPAAIIPESAEATDSITEEVKKPGEGVDTGV